MITARAYTVLRLDNGRQLVSKHSCKVRECASLTKIMTLWVVLRVCEQYRIRIEDTMCEVSEEAAGLIGTSAGLSKDYWVSI
jgi:D-alanyl-D-alanine carboxypeptidase